MSYIYVTGNYDNSVVSINITTPSSPSLGNALVDPTNLPSPGSICGVGNYLFVICDYRLASVNITDPTNMAIADSLYDAILQGGSGGIDTYGSDYVLVARGGYGKIRVYSASDPENISLAGESADLSHVDDVVVYGNYAFVADSMNGNIYILSLSNPTSPSLVNTLSIIACVKLSIYGNYLLLTCLGTQTVHLYDITNPEIPVFKDSYTFTGDDFPFDSGSDGSRIYVVGGPFMTLDRLTVLDMTDPTNITYVTAVNGSGSPNYLSGVGRILVSDGYLYPAANGDNAVPVYNASASPSIQGVILGAGSPNYLYGVGSVCIPKEAPTPPPSGMKGLSPAAMVALL